MRIGVMNNEKEEKMYIKKHHIVIIAFLTVFFAHHDVPNGVDVDDIIQE